MKEIKIEWIEKDGIMSICNIGQEKMFSEKVYTKEEFKNRICVWIDKYMEVK